MKLPEGFVLDEPTPQLPPGFVLDGQESVQGNDSVMDVVIPQAQANQSSQTEQDGTIANAVGSGLLAGFDDEIIGAVGATIAMLKDGASWEDAYRTIRNSIREDKEAFAERNPKTALAGEIAGAAATGGYGGAKLLAKVTGSGAKRGAALVGTGAVEGGLYGAGNADADELISSETGQEAGKGAAFGMIAAPVVGITLKGAKAIGRGLRNKASSSRGAPDQVLKDLKRDSIDVSEVNAKLTALGDDAVLADLGGENIKRLTDAAFQKGSKGAAAVREFVEQRQQQAVARVERSIKSEVGDYENYIAKVDDVIETMKRTAAPLYKSAYEQPLRVTGKLRDAMTVNGQMKPSIAKAWRAASKDLMDEGVELPKDIDISRLGVREIDYIKRGLDKMIERNTSDFGKVNSTGRSLTMLKNKILAEVDDQVSDYAAARHVYSDGASLKRALDDGLKFLRSDADEISKVMSRMTESERAMFQQGAAKSLRDRIAGAPDGADAYKRLYGNQLMREKIDAVMGSKGASERFMKAMNAEKEFAITRNNFANSKTMQRQEKAAEAFESGVGAFADVMTKNPLGLVRRTINLVSRRNAVPDEKKAEQIIKILFSKGASRGQALQLLEAAQANASRQEQAIVGRSIALLSAAKGGDLVNQAISAQQN